MAARNTAASAAPTDEETAATAGTVNGEPTGQAEVDAGEGREKVKTAADGAADNATFHSATPIASGPTATFADRVNPATQLREDDGNRSYARPALDPGPVGREGQAIMKMPDRSKGEFTIRDANPDGVGTNIVRTTTTPPHFARESVVEEQRCEADLIGHGGASDMYNPEGRLNTSLTQSAMERAAAPRELAPQTV